MKEREERDGVLGKSVVDFNCREKLDYMESKVREGSGAQLRK